MSDQNFLKNIIFCVNFAAFKHKNQRRKDLEQTPYINHPIGVANILAYEANIDDLDVIQAALLHDTVEDTDTSFEEIEQNFGLKVASIVREVTDDKTLEKQVRKQLQIEHAPKCSRQAKLVKLADKIYNLRDLQKSTPSGWTEQRVEEYFLWASKVFCGLGDTHPVLETKMEEIFNNRWPEEDWKNFKYNISGCNNN